MFVEDCKNTNKKKNFTKLIDIQIHLGKKINRFYPHLWYRMMREIFFFIFFLNLNLSNNDDVDYINGTFADERKKKSIQISVNGKAMKKNNEWK